jgi:transposase-like protein
LSRQRDINAAKAFLRKAIKGQRVPAKVTLDAYEASHRAVAELEGWWRIAEACGSAQQQVFEQLDRARSPKDQAAVAADVGLKSFETAARVIGGIELAEKIKKGQFKIGKLSGRRAISQEIWQACFGRLIVSGSTQ